MYKTLTEFEEKDPIAVFHLRKQGKLNPFCRAADIKIIDRSIIVLTNDDGTKTKGSMRDISEILKVNASSLCRMLNGKSKPGYKLKGIDVCRESSEETSKYINFDNKEEKHLETIEIEPIIIKRPKMSDICIVNRARR